MWIVRLALRRPYTFVVMALLIAVLGVAAIVTMTVDIFPSINIPVVTVIWNYSGLSPTEMQNRIVTVTERAFTTTVNGIEHIESVSLRGVAITRLYFHPNVPIEAAIAQVNAQAQQIVRVLPPGIFPPLIIQYNAASVPVLLASLSSDQLPEEQLNDLGNNFIRTQLVTIQGASVPVPYGGKLRVANVRLDPDGCGPGAHVDAEDSGRPAVEPQGRLPVRSERLRQGGHHRRASRRGDRRLPDGADDPAVPEILAEHLDRCHVDPAVDPDFRHRAEDPEPVAQRDDAGRDGAGGRHPGGRRDRRDREQSPPHGPGQAPEAGHPRRSGGGSDAPVRCGPVDLHSLPSDHGPGRC